MAVSGNAQKIDVSNYDSFNEKDVTEIGKTELDGSAVAGVTPEMASNIGTALESYATSVKTAFKDVFDLVTNAAEGSTMFQGSVNTALATFAGDVQETVNSFIDGLSMAEKEIVDAVAKAYLENDTTVAGSVDAQTNAMEGFGAQ